MALEVGNRWREYFEPEVRVSTKGGSLAGFVRNQVGVVEYPDGTAYAVAIFTRANAPFERQHVIGRVIPEAAAIAVHSLRATSLSVSGLGQWLPGGSHAPHVPAVE